MKVEEYIEAHYVARTPMVGSQIPIRVIGNLSLKIIVLMLTEDHRIGLTTSSIETTYVLRIGVCEAHCL
jgi:hypothetical protein